MNLNDTSTDNRSTENNENFSGSISEGEIERTTNHEGGVAFEPNSPERRLYKHTVNNLLENTFYEDDEELFESLVDAFNKAADSNPDFVLKLASYARQELGLRDVPQLLLSLSAKDPRFNTYPPESGHQEDTRIRDYTPAIVRRMDETGTVVSIYNNMFEERESIPNGLQRGLSDAINMMTDEYTLAKYRMKGRQVTLYDVFNQVHPSPTSKVENWNGLSDEEREDLFERLMKGNLDEYDDVEPLSTPNTWETTISERGNNREAWLSVVDDMGIMAKTRNIRNMVESGVSGEEIFANGDLEVAKSSKMFPFRFYQAYKAYRQPGVPDDERVENFLSDAVEATAGNIPDEFSNTLVVADTSGSMRQPVSESSNLQCYEIATFFAAVSSSVGADVGAFASSFEETSFHNRTPALDRVGEISSLDVGGSTNGYKVIDKLCEEQRTYDNIVLLTDVQLWDSTLGATRTLKDAFDEYQEEMTDNSSLYIVDIQAYGDMAMPDGYENVYQVSGWSEDILSFISYADREQEILHEISQYEPHPLTEY